MDSTVRRVLVISVLQGLLLMGSEDGLAQEDSAPAVPQSEIEIVEMGQARLDSLTAAVESAPADLGLRLDRVRTMYVLSVSEEELIDQALGELETIATAERSRERGFATPADAYAAALGVVRGKHAFWPRGKWNHVQDGLRILDQLVRDHPDEPEVRYLRLVSCYYLPFFFSRGESVNEDLDALLTLLPRERGVLSQHAYQHVAKFVIEAATDRGRPKSAVTTLRSAVERAQVGEKPLDPLEP